MWEAAGRNAVSALGGVRVNSKKVSDKCLSNPNPDRGPQR